MEPAQRAEVQTRAVMVVFRVERARLERSGLRQEERDARHAALVDRSLEVLDAARAKLDGKAPWHAEALAAIAAARREIEQDAPPRAEP